MRKIPILLPDETKPAWAYPEHFINLFEWNGLGNSICPSTIPVFEVEGRPAYVLNLNNQYRLDWDLAKVKGVNNPCVYDALDASFWIEIERQNGVLVLDSSVEALSPRNNIATGIHRGINKVGLDPSRVAIINCNKKASSILYNNYSGLLNGVKIIDFDTCFWLVAGFNKECADNRDFLLSRMRDAEIKRNVNRQFKFISFNARLRPHRFYIVLWLFSNDLLQHGRVSLLGYMPNSFQSDLSQLRAHLIKSRYPDINNVIKDFDNLIARLPLSIDVTLEESLRGAAYKKTLPWRSQKHEHYDESWFSIVIDTAFDKQDILFLTPIAFKSFMNFSPFIYFGNYGALARMRELGFMTFSPLINESYDQIPDANDRMSAALAEITRLCKMNESELKDLYNELWPILLHNYWHIHKSADLNFKKTIEHDLITPLFS